MKQDLRQIKQKLFQIYYQNLNDKQKEAVFLVKGPLLVIAGAGSGKTTVLVNRISHLIEFGNAYYSQKEISASAEEIAVLRNFCDHPEICTREILKPILLSFADDACPAYHILAITFTNKAAGEMKERLRKQLGDRADEIWAGTFHSVCVRLLRQFASYTQYGSNFLIYDQEDCKRIIAAKMKEMEIDTPELTAKYVMNQISNAKNALLSPKEYESKVQNSSKGKVVAEIFKSYQEALLDANAMDFDDLIAETVKLLRDNSEPLTWCQHKFRYLLVDEYQDTNRAQYQLLKLIAQGHGNIMAVGDDDQSIYKFRGAAVENILNFDQNFADTKVVFLEQNYRSTKNIIEAANAVIAHNETRRGKKLWCAQENGQKVMLRNLEDQEKEAIYIAEHISEAVMRGKHRYKDFAVLYRTRAQSNALETIFTKSGVPHRLLAGMRFYEHAEVKDIIAYLRAIACPDNLACLLRVINVPKRGLGETAIKKATDLAEAQGKSFFEIICDCTSYRELSRNSSSFLAFTKLILSLREYAEDHLPSEIVHEVIDKSGYMDTLLGDENEERRKNVNELISSARFYEERSEAPNLEGFLEEIALVSDVDNYDRESDAVVLMTIHAAKGLEFPVVFLPGVEENLFPSAQSVMRLSDLEEERRLFYVAMTRAKEELYISFCKRRLLFGKTNSNRVSRFVEELPDAYVDAEYIASKERSLSDGYYFGQSDFQEFAMPRFSQAKGSNFSQFRQKDVSFQRAGSSSVTAAATPPTSKKSEVFRPGERVTHRIFGDGTILSAKSYGSDTLYEIRFDKAGEKKLMATYANLQKAK